MYKLKNILLNNPLFRDEVINKNKDFDLIKVKTQDITTYGMW
jgi:hypothetical protein